MNGQEEIFKIELVKRGKIKAEAKHSEFQPTAKKCIICGMENGMADTFCNSCKRPLDREMIEREVREKDEKLSIVTNQLREMAAKQERLETMFLQALAAMNPEKAREKLTPELVKKFIDAEKHTI